MLVEAVSVERLAGAATSVLSRQQLIDSIKAKVRIGDGNLLSAGVQLQEAKRRLQEFGMTWHAFFGECGLERSRVYVLIAIAEGRTTGEAEQAKGRERAARHAAKNKAARTSVSNGLSASADPRVAKITKILADAEPSELPLWEAFASERLSQRTKRPSGSLN
jgi:hypothetical protein